MTARGMKGDSGSMADRIGSSFGKNPEANQSKMSTLEKGPWMMPWAEQEEHQVRVQCQCQEAAQAHSIHT